MTLIKIEAVPDKKDRYILRFEGGENLTCSAAEVADFRLASGKELDEEAYERLSRACEYCRAREKAAMLLSARPMSSGELRQKLKDKGICEEDADKAAEWLESLGILNDAEYAAMVARHYAGKGYGAGRIRNELFKRRVPRSLWDDAVGEIPDGGDQIDKFISSKLKGNSPDEREKRKLIDALRRRGFSWDEIKNAMARYADNMDFTED
jgi:regulatory protein